MRDLGIPQYYYNFSVKHIFNDLDNAASSLIITPIYINNIDNDTAMFIPLTYCDMTCTTVDNIGFFNIDIRINNTNLFKSSFFEKMVAMLFYKLINIVIFFILFKLTLNLSFNIRGSILFAEHLQILCLVSNLCYLFADLVLTFVDR